jgi:hypothetical protein
MPNVIITAIMMALGWPMMNYVLPVQIKRIVMTINVSTTMHVEHPLNVMKGHQTLSFPAPTRVGGVVGRMAVPMAATHPAR